MEDLSPGFRAVGTFGLSSTLHGMEAIISLYDEKRVGTLCNKHITGIKK